MATGLLGDALDRYLSGAPLSPNPDKAAAADQALWSLAANLIGARGPAGPAIGNAVNNAMGSYSQSLRDSLKSKWMDAQMADMQDQAAARKSKQKQAEDVVAFWRSKTTPQPEAAAIPERFDMRAPGAADQTFMRSPGPAPLSPADIARGASLGIDMDTLRKFAEAPTWGRPKVARVIDVPGPNGQPMQQQVDEFGNSMGPPMPKPYERRLEDLGGTKQAYDPYLGGLTGPALPKTMTPGEVASNQLGWANHRTAAGQLGVARAGLDLRRQELAQGKVPAGYRQTADGSLEYIPGGPADPNTAKRAAPTEFQGKSAVFGARAQEAHRILSELEDEGVDDPGIIKSMAGGVPFVGGALAAGVNALPGVLGGPSARQQRVEQARRDFVNANLRQESGAAIADSEFRNADQQYFPQPGDSPEVKAQKRRNREIAVQGTLNNAGPAAFAPTFVDARAPAGRTVSGAVVGAKDLPQHKPFKLDGGGSTIGTLDPATGRYFVMRGGRRYWIEE